MAISKTQLLTLKPWKLTGARSKISAGPWEDVYAFIEGCRVDNIISFSTTSIYTVDEGATKCFGVDPQTFLTTTWTFQNNETQFLLSGTQVKDIIILDENTLQYSEIMNVGWDTGMIEYTYSH